MKLNSKQRKTLARVRKKPTVSDLKWNDAVSLLKAARSDLDESRDGSRVFIKFEGRPVVLHKPHGSKSMVKSAVDQLREILKEI